MEAAIRRAIQPDNQPHPLPFVPVEDAKDDMQPIISSPSFGEDEESPFRETPEEQPRKPFIEANTKQVSLYHLKNDCITPVFSKDNEVTISHNQFIETMWECAQRMFRGDTVDNPEIRVSHIVKGRTPEASTRRYTSLRMQTRRFITSGGCSASKFPLSRKPSTDAG